jgi:hypothetical protein
MAISQEVLEAGEQIAASAGAALAGVLNAGIERVLGWPYKVASGRIVDRDGIRTEAFATVVYTAPDKTSELDLNAVPADNAAAVIDVVENIDLAGFRAAYARIAHAKRLKKSPAPRVAGLAVTTITLGIIYSQQTLLPLEKLAEELELLNARTPSREWPDMVVVGSTGAVQYAVQFPGEPSISSEFLPPAEGALSNYTPAIYVVMVMMPTVPTHSTRGYRFLSPISRSSLREQTSRFTATSLKACPKWPLCCRDINTICAATSFRSRANFTTTAICPRPRYGSKTRKGRYYRRSSTCYGKTAALSC